MNAGPFVVILPLPEQCSRIISVRANRKHAEITPMRWISFIELATDFAYKVDNSMDLICGLSGYSRLVCRWILKKYSS